MGMINIWVDDEINFTVGVPCGWWETGHRYTEDVRIILDRAMDHASSCADCAKKSTATIERGQ